jgi:hypothetical protein
MLMTFWPISPDFRKRWMISEGIMRIEKLIEGAAGCFLHMFSIGDCIHE